MREGFYVLYGVLILLVSLIVYEINSPTREYVGCGVVDPIIEEKYPKGSDALKGKYIFNANCAACHHLDRNMTGPALRGVYGKYQKQNLDWNQFITAGSDKRVLKDTIDWGFKCMKFPQLTEEQINQLVVYIE